MSSSVISATSFSPSGTSQSAIRRTQSVNARRRFWSSGRRQPLAQQVHHPGEVRAARCAPRAEAPAGRGCPRAGRYRCRHRVRYRQILFSTWCSSSTWYLPALDGPLACTLSERAAMHDLVRSGTRVDGGVRGRCPVRDRAPGGPAGAGAPDARVRHREAAAKQPAQALHSDDVPALRPPAGQGPRFSDFGSEGYVITWEAARLLLERIPRMVRDLDHELSYFLGERPQRPLSRSSGRARGSGIRLTDTGDAERRASGASARTAPTADHTGAASQGAYFERQSSPHRIQAPSAIGQNRRARPQPARLNIEAMISLLAQTFYTTNPVVAGDRIGCTTTNCYILTERPSKFRR